MKREVGERQGERETDRQGESEFLSFPKSNFDSPSGNILDFPFRNII
jgi:hypothetical protein